MLDRILRRPPTVWLLILLCLALWGGEFVRRGLWEPDEARYAYVAREMREDGNWLVPHIYGEPYPDKPPMLFWLINASSLLTGGRINGISARLPTLLGSILTLWVVAQLAARWHGVQAAWRSVLVLMTSFMFWREGGWARTDALLCGLVMMSVYFLVSSKDGNPLGREILAYVFAGLAVLTKGPVGLLMSVGIYACVSVAGRDLRRPLRSHWLWGPFVALLIPGIWLLAAWLADAPRQYFISMFTEESFARAVHSIGHSRSPVYFLWHFPLEFMPWTIFLPALIATFSDRTLKRRLVAWLVFVIGLFSLFTCKRNIYILAAYPAAAMLIGAAWNDLPRLSRKSGMALGIATVGPVCLIGVAEAVAMFLRQIPFNRWTLIPPACVMIPGAIVLGYVFRRERLSARWFSVLAGTMFLHQIAVSAAVLPAMNSIKTPAGFAEEVAACLKPGEPVYLFQEQMAIFPLYAGRPGRQIRSFEELQTIMSDQAEGVVVFADNAWESALRFPTVSVDVHEIRMGQKKPVWIRFARK